MKVVDIEDIEPKDIVDFDSEIDTENVFVDTEQQ